MSATSVAAVSMCKDEHDIIEASLRRMAGEVDFLIVADNASTDGTRDLLSDLARDLPLTVLDDAEVGYFQSEKMTWLAHLAAVQGAEWVVPFDADEIWYSPFGRIADILTEHKGAVATADVYDHRATSKDPADGDPFSRMGWRTREPIPLHKIACRPILSVTIEQGNHGARYPTEHPLDGQLVVRHFPLRSVEQMIRKARNGGRAYAATDLPEDVGAHWRGWNHLSDEQLAGVFHEFYFSPHPEHDSGLMFDPAPVASRAG